MGGTVSGWSSSGPAHRAARRSNIYRGAGDGPATPRLLGQDHLAAFLDAYNFSKRPPAIRSHLQGMGSRARTFPARSGGLNTLPLWLFKGDIGA